MTFQVKVVDDQSFDERLSQFGKSLFSSGCEKARLRLFGLRQIFRLWQFLNILPNLINFNLTAINLNVIHPTSINLASATSSSAITTNPDSTLPRLNYLQHWGKWCSYPTESLDELSIKVCKSEEHLDVLYWLRLRPLLDNLNSFVLHADAFWGHHIAEEPNFFLMKSTFLQVGKQQKLPELLQYPLYGWDVPISVIISVDQNVIQIHNDENVKLLGKDLVDVSLEACWCVC